MLVLSMKYKVCAKGLWLSARHKNDLGDRQLISKYKNQAIDLSLTLTPTLTINHDHTNTKNNPNPNLKTSPNPNQKTSSKTWQTSANAELHLIVASRTYAANI